MKVILEPGKYVATVSGGVDSMVLLDVLRRQADLELVVAHFDHGIREDSGEDRRLVQDVAAEYGLPFEFEAGKLGPSASEAAARTARYDFLRRIQAQHQAHAILTAHHQDDVIETAILNLLRGTGPKGLSALRSHDDIVRPLLDFPKKQLRAYAEQHAVRWREDSTNTDSSHLRNYIRLHIVPKLSETDRQKLLAHIAEASVSNELITRLSDALLPPARAKTLDRRWFSGLPHAVARELMAAWLRQQGVRNFDRPLIERLVTAAKVAAPGKRADALKGVILHINNTELQLIQPEPSSKSLTGV